MHIYICIYISVCKRIYRYISLDIVKVLQICTDICIYIYIERETNRCIDRYLDRKILR